MRFTLLITLLLGLLGALLLRHISRCSTSSLTGASYIRRCKGLLLIVLVTLVALWQVTADPSSPSTGDAETMIMLDVSKSMLVQDTAGGQSRLDAAKSIISELIATAPSQKRGLGIFAGETQGILPPNDDHDLLFTFLAGLDHRNLTKQGTNLTEAITYASQHFSTGDHQKTILLVSDGGDEELSLAKELAKQIEQQHIATLIVGVGSEQGGPIPESSDAFGNIVYKQWQGETVLSKIDTASLKEIADTVRGSYIPATRLGAARLSKTVAQHISSGRGFSAPDLPVLIVLAVLLSILRLHLTQKTEQLDHFHMSFRQRCTNLTSPYLNLK